MRRFRRLPLILALLLALLPAWARPAAAGPGAAAAVAQTRPPEPTPTPARPQPQPVDIKALLARMTAADKVGQLFLVTFEGADVEPGSDIATLVRDYRVGGVVLLPANGNFRNVPVPAPVPAAPATPITATTTATPPAPALLTTPQQIAALANALQALALGPSQPITPALTGAPTALPLPPGQAEPAPAALSAGPGTPLFIAVDWTGDDSSFFAGTGGFTPLPSAMAMGATWSPALTEQIGQVVGQELAATGVNLLLGPTLDVLDVPRPGNKGDLGTRTFGGDPFWVGQMGQGFIRGVQAGSGRAVLTAAKHFPGQGASDRWPEDEVATVQKSVQQLRQIELAPFAAATASTDIQTPGITAALMTSHIRYRGLQGNIRVTTPPISLAPELGDLMALKEFADWRAAGGVLISDALGVPAVRRYYNPQLQAFPHRQVAQDAFLAGNDLLYLGRFSLTDQWADQFLAIKETITFFQEKYGSDSAFRARVDASVERLLRLKLGIFGESWELSTLQRATETVAQQVGQSTAATQAVARTALTLIYPGRDEFADRMPSAPLADEQMLIFTDGRLARECATCPAAPIIAPDAIQEIILRLYGPTATGQVDPENIRSLTFEDLARFLAAPSGQERATEEAIAEARWIIFAQLDYSPQEHPASAALRSFLAKRSDSLRDKRLVVLAFDAPYYLDTTEISKLTAYFGVYGRTAPFLETAVRALFREFTPVGAPPVSVTGINYELIRELEPAAGQIIPLAPVSTSGVITGSIQVGGQITLEAGVILDRKGHPVPDGTPVEFYLRYPTESLALAPKVETTIAGRARTTVALDRAGELWITVQAGEARDSTRIELKVGGDAPGSIATVIPTPTPLPTITPTATAPPTPTGEPTLSANAADAPGKTPPGPQRRVTMPAFWFGLVGMLAIASIAFMLRRRALAGADPSDTALVRALSAALWAGVAAWTAYILYAVGWLPGSTAAQAGGHVWVAAAVTFLGGAVSLPWTAGRGARA